MWDLLFSAAGGGVLGLIGTGVKSFVAYKQEQQRLESEERKMNLRLLEMDKELELAKFHGQLNLELQESTNDAQGLQAATLAEQATGTDTYMWVNAVRGLVRPVLTAALTVMAFVKPEEEDIVWMASTAVTFWFGDRPLQRK